MTNSSCANRAMADISFDRLSPTEWRISDRRFPAGSSECVLGFVARDTDGFVLTRISRPWESVSFASLDHVARALALDGRFSAPLVG
ncbi:hypothetical protein [Marisediminicola senii]|uniref:hypothetical protein n=1 Tax=Marisediminicola senii TaxID=2711233 RepID=UPI0013EB2F61|nr:hypothetical protein [Marisediminicola senii]